MASTSVCACAVTSSFDVIIILSEHNRWNERERAREREGERERAEEKERKRKRKSHCYKTVKCLVNCFPKAYYSETGVSMCHAHPMAVLCSTSAPWWKVDLIKSLVSWRTQKRRKKTETINWLSHWVCCVNALHHFDALLFFIRSLSLALALFSTITFHDNSLVDTVTCKCSWHGMRTRPVGACVQVIERAHAVPHQKHFFALISSATAI